MPATPLDHIAIRQLAEARDVAFQLWVGGLPVGTQVVGRSHADALTIAVAGVLGEVAGGYEVPPGFV